MSIKKILENTWRQCKMEGVELSTVDFTIIRGLSGESAVCETEYSGRAVNPIGRVAEKPQTPPDE